MMRRLCARTKSFTTFTLILFLTGLVCYLSYSSTWYKGGVIQNQKKCKSTQVMASQEAKEIDIDHQRDELFAKIFDQLHWKDEHVEGSTGIQKDLQLQSLDSVLSQSNTIKSTLKSFSPVSSQQLDTRTSSPTRESVIRNAVYTKNQIAEPESIKTRQLTKSSSLAVHVSQENTKTVKPTTQTLSLPSKQTVITQSSLPTKHLVKNSTNTKNTKAELQSIETFSQQENSGFSKTVARSNTIAMEPAANRFSKISREKANYPTFSPTRNITAKSVKSEKQKTKQLFLKTSTPNLQNFEVIKNHSTPKLLFKEPSAIESAKQKENVDLFIAILSAPQRLDRRAVLRNTWISSIPNYSVAFRFFTDGKELSNRTKKVLLKEQKRFGDVEMLPTKGGYWFSHRFLHALFWAHRHYNFSYFLRLDDDYFICLHHLYHDLQHRKKEKFLYWGWLWCQNQTVRIDEAFVLLGADLAHEIIRRNESLYCHPFGDQMIEMWLNRLKREGIKVKYFPDNIRILHFGLGSFQPSQRLCQDFLGVHKSYPDRMRFYWNRTKKVWYSSPESFKKVTIKNYTNYCKFPRGYNWKAMPGFYQREPKPCWKAGVDWPRLHLNKIHLGDEPRLTAHKPSKRLKLAVNKNTTSKPSEIESNNYEEYTYRSFKETKISN